jgi:hypothetical protein
MIKMFRLLLMAIVAVSLVGCDLLAGTASVGDAEMEDIFSTESENDSTEKKNVIDVMGVTFTPGYKHFKIFVSLNEDIGDYAITDSNEVTVKTTEYIGRVPNNSSSKPVLTFVRNTEAETVDKERLKVLMLVDLDQSQEVVDRELAAVREVRLVFGKNLYLAFMAGRSVTETMQASDYVLEHRFKSDQSQPKYLYRSIVLKKKEIEDRVGVWADAKKVFMVIFSDEMVYADSDEPIDPDHFDLEEQLVKQDSLQTPNFLSISGARFVDRDEQMNQDNQAGSVLKVLAMNNGGIYMDTFKWSDLKENIMGLKTENIIANEFDFDNPDGKVYSGVSHIMKIELFAKDDGHLIGSTSTAIILGDTYNPVIVNGYTNISMFLQGIGLGLLVILHVYLIFQLLIPYIQYKRFQKKYVVKYVPGNMSVGNISVSESCYYCKAPFEPDDEIVVKCRHVMHKSCWDENGYHCPEHGRRCPEGSHYYNHANLFDHKNALYQMKWIIISVIAAMVAWFLYVFLVLELDHTTPSLVAKMVDVKLDYVDSHAIFNNIGENTGFVPLFGMCLSSCLTLAFSMMAAKRQSLHILMLSFFIRVVIVAVVTYLVFLLTESVTVALDMNPWLAVFDWIPWAIMALMIAYVSTTDSRIHLRKYILLIAVILGVVSIYVWSWLFQGVMQLDVRVLLLFSCIFYSVGVGLAVAQLVPVSERYFLNVKGAVKETDIALFKWFLNNPDEVVTIGKSIDCSLQMTWDIKGQVAPVHANIRQTIRGIRLTALEEGVLVGTKPLPPGNSCLLYHNSHFTIGDTTFTYIERDI